MNLGFVEIRDNESIARELLEKADELFCQYLGYEDGVDEGVKEIIEADSRHKYWVVYIDGGIAGILYIYDYKEKYKKCSLGYDLLEGYREKGYSTEIVDEFCNFLEEVMGIIRIQVDIETTNKSCISWFNKRALDMGFEFECLAKNYWGSGIECRIYSRCK